MKRLLFLFLLGLTLPLGAQEPRSTEEFELFLRAVARVDGVTQAIIANDERAVMVKEGQQVGDFKIVEIASESVLVEYEGEPWKIEFEYRAGPKAEAFDASKRFSMDVEGWEFEEVLEKVTRGMGADLISGGLDASVEGWLEDLSGREALEACCAQLEVESQWVGEAFCVHRTGEKPAVSGLAPGEEPALSLAAQDADFVILLQMIARLAGKNVFSDADVAGIATAHLRSASPVGAARALAGVQAASYGLVEKAGWWYVTRPDRAREFEVDSGWVGEFDESPRIHLETDYVNADLIYILNLLAERTGRSMVLSREVEGAVNLSMSEPAPVLAVLSLLMSGQGRDVESMDWNFGPDFLTSPPVDIAPDSSGPRVSFAGEEPWIQVPASEVLAEVARALELELDWPADFDVELYVNLREAPARSALDHIVGVIGCEYAVEGTSLRVSRPTGE